MQLREKGIWVRNPSNADALDPDSLFTVLAEGYFVAFDGIPSDLKRFILGRIKSVESLEVMLLLHGKPDREWRAEEVSRALYTSVESAAMRLADLHAAGVLAVRSGNPPAYRFSPAQEAWGALVNDLEKNYKERRVTIISLIYSQASEHIRAFSDAFIIRKDKE